MHQPIAVQAWPGRLSFGPEGILVLGLELTLAHSSAADARTQARLALRQALTQALAALLQRPLADLQIDNQRGQPPRIRLADGAASAPTPQCSFAYSDTYALAAVNLHGPIGVDLTPVMEMPDWQAVARDYLGPQEYIRLQAMPAAQRPRALAQAWCQLEAQLKCRAEALTEWQGEWEGARLHRQASLLLPPYQQAPYQQQAQQQAQQQVPPLVGHVVWRPAAAG
ncbi:4'-phosphopantetheinyl transferase superfamily protein [Duganella fentianensis]|uniref:4'-phosphopantetheinyl transferase family protein n=1 Tax=Duganella fentianensis TaxID=2692177 RepID=UPI0032B1B521